MFKIIFLINFFISITVSQVVSNQLINKVELEQIPDVVPYIKSNQKNINFLDYAITQTGINGN